MVVSDKSRNCHRGNLRSHFSIVELTLQWLYPFSFGKRLVLGNMTSELWGIFQPKGFLAKTKTSWKLNLIDWTKYKNHEIMGRGSLRCHDGNDNEIIKKAMDWIGTTTTVHVHHAFLYISLPSLHDDDWKRPINFTFYGGRKQATTKFSFSLWTWIWFLGIWLKKSSFAFDKVNELQ